jgi:acyl-coenzyme A synthetase/AMP-(fatty) acid ligase
VAFVVARDLGPRQIVFVDDLPKGLLDKVLKRELRARLIDTPAPA